MNSSTLLRDFVATLSPVQKAALLPIVSARCADLQAGVRSGTDALGKLYAEFDAANELALLLAQSAAGRGQR